MSRRWFLICAVVLGICGTAVASHEKSLAVLGDSIATGAGASDRVQATYTAFGWNYLVHGVNYPENTFSQIIASRLGIKPERVFNLAKNGRRIDSMAWEFGRLSTKTSTMPDYFLISFNGNDACSEEVFRESAEHFRQRYLRTFLDGADGKGGLRSLVRTMPIVRDTTIFVMASLDFMQVLTSDDILSHEVPLHFSTVRCERFRVGWRPEGGPRISYFADNAYRMCRGILGTHPKSQDVISVFRRKHLTSLHHAMIESQEEAVATVNRENRNSHLKIYFVTGPARLSFQGEHIANDCFHLSQKGQALLGLRIWDEVYDYLR